MTKGRISQNGVKVEIEYDGEYPNLCSGTLLVFINGKRWGFPDYCLGSGGCVWFDDNWGEHVNSGEWSIGEYPKDFPAKYEDIVLDAVNDIIPHGCCGGCV